MVDIVLFSKISESNWKWKSGNFSQKTLLMFILIFSWQRRIIILSFNTFHRTHGTYLQNIFQYIDLLGYEESTSKGWVTIKFMNKKNHSKSKLSVKFSMLWSVLFFNIKWLFFKVFMCLLRSLWYFLFWFLGGVSVSKLLDFSCYFGKVGRSEIYENFT